MNLKDKDQKIVGYVLLIAGLCVMAYSIISVIGVFTGGDVPIEILHASENQENATMQPTIDEGGNVTMPSMDLGQIIEPMFPLFNLMGWLSIAFILLVGGQKIARVGIDLMKASIPQQKKAKFEKDKSQKP